MDGKNNQKEGYITVQYSQMKEIKFRIPLLPQVIIVTMILFYVVRLRIVYALSEGNNFNDPLVNVARDVTILLRGDHFQPHIATNINRSIIKQMIINGLTWGVNTTTLWILWVYKPIFIWVFHKNPDKNRVQQYIVYLQVVAVANWILYQIQSAHT